MTEDTQADRTPEAIHTRNALSLERVLKEPAGSFIGWRDYRILAIKVLDALGVPADVVVADSIEVGDENLTYKRFLERGEAVPAGARVESDSQTRVTVADSVPIPDEHRAIAEELRLWFVTPHARVIHGGHFLKLTMEQWGGVTGHLECREPAGSICNQWCKDEEHAHEHTGSITEDCTVEPVGCMAVEWWNQDTSAAMEGYTGDETEAHSGIITITQWGEDGLEWHYAEAGK